MPRCSGSSRSSIGLPGLAGFVGEFLVMLGAFQYSGWVAAWAMLVVIASAVYMLWMFQRAFFAVPSDWMRRAWNGLTDLTRLEWASLAPLVILVVLILLGYLPQDVLRKYVEKRLQSGLGAGSSIGKMHTVPGRLSTDIEDLVIQGPTYRLSVPKARVDALRGYL